MTARDARLAHARDRLGDRWPADALARARDYRHARSAAIREAQAAGLTLDEVAAELGIHISSLNEWLAKYPPR